MEKQISIIIPTYNMESYIGKCLDSLLIPELDAVEVLVVNDGSKDRSSEIAHSYAKCYPNSIRVIDKENGNYGSCINTALPLATGRYVKVLDADDTFDAYAFSRLVNCLGSVNDDVVVTDFMEVDDAGNPHPSNRMSKYGLPAGKTLRLDEMGRADILQLAMHGIAYRRAIFSNIAYHQTEGISYTDTEWRIQPLCHAETVRYIDVGILYRYLIGREGQTMDPAIYLKSQRKVLDVWLSNATYLSANSMQINEKIIKRMEDVIAENLYWVYWNYQKTEDHTLLRELAEFDRKLSMVNSSVFEQMERIKYFHRVNFHLVKGLRKKKFSPFKIPWHVNFRIKLVRWSISVKQLMTSLRHE